MSATRLSTITTAALALSALASGALAQQPGGFYQPNPATSAEMGFSYHHASTLAEGAQRGRAALIHAQGSYELNRAQSMVLFEQARSLWFDNKVKQVETLYRKKYLRQQHRDQERARAIAKDVVGKELLAQRRATYYRDVYRLAGDELNRTTGAIDWPEALADTQFDKTRRKLDFLFRQRAKVTSYAGTDPFAARILKLTEELKGELKQQVAELPPASYADAQKFVRGLIYEIQYAESTPQIG